MERNSQQQPLHGSAPGSPEGALPLSIALAAIATAPAGSPSTNAWPAGEHPCALDVPQQQDTKPRRWWRWLAALLTCSEPKADEQGMLKGRRGRNRDSHASHP